MYSSVFEKAVYLFGEKNVCLISQRGLKINLENELKTIATFLNIDKKLIFSGTLPAKTKSNITVKHEKNLVFLYESKIYYPLRKQFRRSPYILFVFLMSIPYFFRLCIKKTLKEEKFKAGTSHLLSYYFHL